MKKILSITCAALVLAFLAGCGGGKTETKTESKGYFGKLASIKQNLDIQDSTLKAKAKTEVKSVDDIVKVQSDLNKLKQDAEAEYMNEVSKLKLPITLPFVDSSGAAGYVVKDAKITAIDWDRATLVATIEIKTDSEKSAGGQNMQFSVPVLMLDADGKVIKDHADNHWLILAVTKEMKAGETHDVTGYLKVNNANVALNKLLFKSFDDYKKAKGWN